MIVQNRIEGTRITVRDVLHYLTAGWSCPNIAAPLHLTEAQVAAAASYIEEHREEVMVVQRQIEGRKARGNSPEIREKRFLTPFLSPMRAAQVSVRGGQHGSGSGVVTDCCAP